MGKKPKPNFQPYGNKRSGKIGIGGAPSKNNIGIGGTRNSKGQSGSGGNSRKTHDTKGKNNHGRSGKWF
jgi:hypothetical protein